MSSDSAVWKVAWVVVVMRALLRGRHCQLERSSFWGQIRPKLTLFDTRRGEIEDGSQAVDGNGGEHTEAMILQEDRKVGGGEWYQLNNFYALKSRRGRGVWEERWCRMAGGECGVTVVLFFTELAEVVVSFQSCFTF